MLAAPRPETIGEPHKILFVNLVEDRPYGLLNDLIFQGCDAQGTLPPIGFRNVGSLGRLRSIRSPMDSAMQIRQLLMEVRLILFPRHAVDSRRGFPLQSVKAYPQQIDGNVVEQRALIRLRVRGAVAFPPCPPPAVARRCSSTSSVLRNRPTPHRRACCSRLMAFSNRPAASSATGAHGVSRFSRVEFPCMPGVSDCAESSKCSR
jgi:hypothetical protein